MPDIGPPAGKEVVDAEHFAALGQAYARKGAEPRKPAPPVTRMPGVIHGVSPDGERNWAAMQPTRMFQSWRAAGLAQGRRGRGVGSARPCRWRRSLVGAARQVQHGRRGQAESMGMTRQGSPGGEVFVEFQGWMKLV